jgi:hypothetical protein
MPSILVANARLIHRFGGRPQKMEGVSQQAIDLFWLRYGKDNSFPRSIERLVALALPLTIIRLSLLSMRAVENWLRQRGVPFRFNCQSRTIRGCLVAFAGRGLIFIDDADSEDEQRFTAAHEIAHFLVDYWLPREKAIQKFGPSIADVMDGLRGPTPSERFGAILVNTRIGIYSDLMARNEDEPHNMDVWQIEDRADSIALELLAPQHAVLSTMNIAPLGSFSQRVEAVDRTLRVGFGLPASVSGSYSRFLLRSIGRGPSWMESLGFG